MVEGVEGIEGVIHSAPTVDIPDNTHTTQRILHVIRAKTHSG